MESSWEVVFKMSNWNQTKIKLPEEGKVVITISYGGIEQELVRKGNLWFYPDYSSYIYYSPVYWKYIGLG